MLTRRAMIAGALAAPLPLWSAPMVFEDFTDGAGDRWAFVTDGVMGGVSQGQAGLVETEDGPAARLSGQVSTDNNGGFIQIRRRFETGLLANTREITVTARGNGEEYWVFLRPEGMARRWYSYRHAFTVTGEWADYTLPLGGFEPSHAGMAPTFRPEDVFSLGLVAYGRDFEALLDVRRITVAQTTCVVSAGSSCSALGRPSGMS